MSWLPTVLASLGAGAFALVVGTRRAAAASKRTTRPGGGRLLLRTTAYWPFTATETERQREGGVLGAAKWRGKVAIDPSTGKRPTLYTLEDALAGKAPYVSLSGDPEVWPLGQRLEIDAWPGVEFRVVDTGGNFRGANKKYREDGAEPIDVCVYSRSTKVPETTGARIVPGDNWEGGTLVAVSNLRGQTVTGYTILGAAAANKTATNPQTITAAQSKLKASAQAAITAAAALKRKAQNAKQSTRTSMKIKTRAVAAADKVTAAGNKLLALVSKATIQVQKQSSGTQPAAQVRQPVQAVRQPAAQVRQPVPSPQIRTPQVRTQKAADVRRHVLGDDLADAQTQLQQAQQAYDDAVAMVKQMSDDLAAARAARQEDPGNPQLEDDLTNAMIAAGAIVFGDPTLGAAHIALDDAVALVAALQNQPPPPPSTPPTTPSPPSTTPPSPSTTEPDVTPPSETGPTPYSDPDGGRGGGSEPTYDSSEERIDPEEDVFADVPRGDENPVDAERDLLDDTGLEDEQAITGYHLLGGVQPHPLVDWVQRGEEFAAVVSPSTPYSDEDRKALARAIESSCRRGTIEEKQAVGWVCRNRARKIGTTISALLAPDGTYGPRGEGGRDFVSTALEPGDVSEKVAKVVLLLRDDEDPTDGAFDFWNPAQQDRAKVLADVQALMVGAEPDEVAILRSEDLRRVLLGCGLHVVGHVGELELLG